MTDLATIDTPPASKPPAPAFKLLSDMHTNGLDSKRRLTIPADWRFQMGNPTHVLVMKDVMGKGLIVFTPDSTEAYYKKIDGKTLDPKIRKISLSIGKNSETLLFDNQGRIRISERLLTLAGIKNTATLIGCGNRIEIFAPEDVPPDDPSEQEELAAAMQKLWGSDA